MSTPLTWKNIKAPGVSTGEAYLSRLAGENLVGAMSSLGDIVEDKRAVDKANWAQQKKNTTASLLGDISQTDDINILTGDQFGQKNLSGVYGAQYDQEAINKALEQRIGTRSNEMIGEAVLGVQNSYATPAERQNRMETALRKAGAPDHMIGTMTSAAMKIAQPEINAIQAADKNMKTNQFITGLSEMDYTQRNNAVLEIAADSARYDMSKIASVNSIIDQTEYDKAFKQVGTEHQPGMSDIDLIDNVRILGKKLSPDNQEKLIHHATKVYGTTPGAKENAAKLTALAGVEMQRDFDTAVLPVQQRLAELTGEIALYAPEQKVIGMAQDQRYANPGILNRLADDFNVKPRLLSELSSNAQKSFGLTEGEANYIFMDISQNPEMKAKFMGFWQGDKTDLAKRLFENYAAKIQRLKVLSLKKTKLQNALNSDTANLNNTRAIDALRTQGTSNAIITKYDKTTSASLKQLAVEDAKIKAADKAAKALTEAGKGSTDKTTSNDFAAQIEKDTISFHKNREEYVKEQTRKRKERSAEISELGINFSDLGLPKDYQVE